MQCNDFCLRYHYAIKIRISKKQEESVGLHPTIKISISIQINTKNA